MNIYILLQNLASRADSSGRSVRVCGGDVACLLAGSVNAQIARSQGQIGPEGVQHSLQHISDDHNR